MFIKINHDNSKTIYKPWEKHKEDKDNQIWLS